ncbi:zinc finger protein 62-like [Anastrepha ludens]|uniref:zinc finger protein 62-like n=1 Tax=Anastrepha ludens TaxID=28586 RepID=UPI0023B12B27|nr:zinc finger protein 62-like [Anastrepha ludens]
MSLLTKENAKDHCRTCLKRLNGCTEMASSACNTDETPDNKDMHFNICSDPELQHLVCTYVDGPYKSEAPNLAIHNFPENVCLGCYNKLQNFVAFRKRAQQSAEKLRTVLNCSSGIIKVELNYEEEENEQQKTDPVGLSVWDYKLQDALMENEEVFFETSVANLADVELKDDAVVPFEPLVSECSGKPSPPSVSECSGKQSVEKEDDVKKEMSQVDKKDKYKCSHCEQSYAFNSELESHVRQAHDITKMPFSCGHCDKSYRYIRSLQEHVKHKHQAVVSADAQFKCTLCPKAFLTNLSLKKHMCFHIKKDMSRVCGICSKRFPVKSWLVEHLRTHSTDGRIPCGQCDKSFMWYQDLLNHERSSHLKEKLFPCKLCDKSFQTQKSLRFHSYRHSGEKPYLCDVCGKGFRQPTAMKQHRLKHFKNDTTEKNKRKMPFLTKENLKQHCRTCLKKLKIQDNSLMPNVDVADEVSECISIVNNEELQNLIASYMEEHWPIEVRELILGEYPQCVCIHCYNKLQSFGLFRELIKKSAKKLQAILCHGVNEVEIDDDGPEENQGICKEPETARATDTFNFLHKDTLMETESVKFESENVGTLMSESVPDPDPFHTDISTKRKATQSEISNNAVNEENYDQVWQSYSQDESEVDLEKPSISVTYENVDSRILKSQKVKSNLTNTLECIPNDKHNDDGLGNIMCTRARSKRTAEYVATKIEKHKKGMKEAIEVSQHAQKLVDTDQADSEPKRRNKGTKNRFKCEQCSHSFAQKITLEAHRRKVHEGSKRPFQCDRCEKSYKFIGSLYTHNKEVHEAEVRSYSCNIPGCDRVYTSFIAMQRHKQLKHSDTPCVKEYVCEQCGATFNQSGNLKSHRRSKHPTDAEQTAQDQLKERFECDVCKKVFHSRYTLKYHTLQLHTNEMRYECNVCGRKMAKKFMLVQHMLVHSTAKMLCEHCGKGFVRKFELEAHVRIVHMKLKPFKCQYCSECFAIRKTLRHHEYIHTGEKPYVCDVCGQAYRHQSCLKNHRESHERINVDNVISTNSNGTLMNSDLNAPYHIIAQKIVPLTNGNTDATNFSSNVNEVTNL